MEVGEDQAHHRPHRRHSSIVVANLEALEAAGLISIVQPLQEQIWRKEEADQGVKGRRSPFQRPAFVPASSRHVNAMRLHLDESF
jgi:hypothetical protein